MHIAQTRTIARDRRSWLVLLAAALLGALAALIVASHATAMTTAPQVKAVKTKLGTVLVTGKGRTLYMFAVDKNGKSACYGTCAAFWPPLLTTAKHVTTLGLKPALVGTTMRTSGKLQVTYDHHPLYLFVKDTKAGQMNGQGLNASGGLWWVMSPAGLVIKRSVPTGGATGTTGGGGYSSGGGGGYGAGGGGYG
jgi:predicted lipoprotein with Yx(FWY)xxD motif